VIEVIWFAALVVWAVIDNQRSRKLAWLLHQERMTVAMACSALKNVPDRYDDRHAFVSARLAEIDARVSRRPK